MFPRSPHQLQKNHYYTYDIIFISRKQRTIDIVKFSSTYTIFSFMSVFNNKFHIKLPANESTPLKTEIPLCGGWRTTNCANCATLGLGQLQLVDGIEQMATATEYPAGLSVTLTPYVAALKLPGDRFHRSDLGHI